MENNELQNLRLLDDFINLRGAGRDLYQGMFDFVHFKVKNYDNAEDIMADVQVKVLKSLYKADSYNPEMNPKAWVQTIANNCVIDFYRKKRRNRTVSLNIKINNSPGNGDDNLCFEPQSSEQTPDETLEGIEDSILNQENLNVLRQAVEMLPEKYRDVMRLVYYDGAGYKGAAKQLGVSFGEVASRIRVGRAKLEKILRVQAA